MEEEEWHTSEDDGISESCDDCCRFVGAEDVDGDRPSVHECSSKERTQKEPSKVRSDFRPGCRWSIGQPKVTPDGNDDHANDRRQSDSDRVDAGALDTAEPQGCTHTDANRAIESDDECVTGELALPRREPAGNVHRGIGEQHEQESQRDDRVRLEQVARRTRCGKCKCDHESAENDRCEWNDALDDR